MAEVKPVWRGNHWANEIVTEVVPDTPASADGTVGAPLAAPEPETPPAPKAE